MSVAKATVGLVGCHSVVSPKEGRDVAGHLVLGHMPPFLLHLLFLNKGSLELVSGG